MSSDFTKLRRVKKIFAERKRPTSQLLGINRGTPMTKRKAFAKERCSRCLWNWEELRFGKRRMCYHNCSEYYHKEAPVEACRYFEYKVGERAEK